MRGGQTHPRPAVAPQTERAPRRVTVLGATGAVGRRTLEVIEAAGSPYRIQALTAASDAKGLAALARRHSARYACVADESAYDDLCDYLQGTETTPLAGPQGERAVCLEGADWVMAAVSGYACYPLLIDIIPHCRTLALANKEALVCAGAEIRELAAASGCALAPVDSEHASLFRLLGGYEKGDAVSATLTASGGAFRDTPLEKLKDVRPEDAVKHPVWNMGAKITVDSATMMNKGLEIIEAHALFPCFAPGEVDAVIHRESVVHAFVNKRDGTTAAHLYTADMGFPVAQAWGYPEQAAAPPPHCAPFSPAALSSLHFAPVCRERYPCFYLALDALKAGGAAPAVLNIANEAAVAAFLQERIDFTAIARITEHTLARFAGAPAPAGEDFPAFAEEIKHVCNGMI